eukprot:GHVR01103222.1.p1 GENE.GHVR01103222.1~~GHVR01103222.1.p1  ORF type:complete len:142 (+),score=1.51 GHVR01103222.1:10-435(+)
MHIQYVPMHALYGNFSRLARLFLQRPLNSMPLRYWQFTPELQWQSRGQRRISQGCRVTELSGASLARDQGVRPVRGGQLATGCRQVSVHSSTQIPLLQCTYNCLQKVAKCEAMQVPGPRSAGSLHLQVREACVRTVIPCTV